MSLKLLPDLDYFCSSTHMKKLRSLAFLMAVAILAITGFQTYWLKENYEREQKSLTLKTQAAFRETFFDLQVSKLKFDKKTFQSVDSAGKVKIYMKDDLTREIKIGVRPKKEIISTINVIRDRLKDTLNKKRTELPSTVIVSMDKEGMGMTEEGIHVRKPLPPGGPRGDRVFSLLYGVDSLMDSISVQEIDSAFRLRLKEEHINIPFTIKKLDPEKDEISPANTVTMGLKEPVHYGLQTGNTIPYLLKRISLPLVFSLILIGITVMTFVLLYRNMIRQKRLAEVKNEFISNITHELKTPIATVGVAIEALKNFNAIHDPERTREYLDISSNELHRLGFLVDKVLKLSMFEKKDVDLQYENVDLRQIVNEVTDSLRLQLEKYHAQVDVLQNGEVGLQGDRLHLLSVIFNLLDNALKYSKEDPQIKIELSGRQNEVLINITDNGIGIPTAYQEKVFEKFFRVPHGDVHNAKGYGLGLSYVAEVIKKHHGTIRVESIPSGGSEFIISLPKHRP